MTPLDPPARARRAELRQHHAGADVAIGEVLHGKAKARLVL